MLRLLRFALLIVPFCLLTSDCLGQDTQLDAGVHPFQSYVHDRENVSMSSGNVNINIPLLSMSGRAGNNVALNFTVNSQIWVPQIITYPEQKSNSSPQTVFTYFWAGKPSVGVGIPTARLSTGTWPYSSLHALCTNGASLIMPDGASYTFNKLISGCTFDNGAAVPQSDIQSQPIAMDDQSAGIVADITDLNNVVFAMPDGFIYVWTNPKLSKWIDRNGNTTTYTTAADGSSTTILDTLGRAIVIDASIMNLFPGTGTTATTGTITYPGPNNSTQTITIGTTPLSAKDFCPLNPLTSTSSEFRPNGGTIVPRSYASSYIQLPNGLTYTFFYNMCGEVTLVTYPTGGYTKYSYTGNQLTHYYMNPYGSPESYIQANYHVITEKDVCLDAVVPLGTTTAPDPSTLKCPSGEAQTLYSGVVSGSSLSSMAVTTPDQTTTTHQSSGSANANYGSLGENSFMQPICCFVVPVETGSVVTAGGAPIRSTSLVYDTDGIHVKSKTTILEDGQTQRREEWDWQQLGVLGNSQH